MMTDDINVQRWRAVILAVAIIVTFAVSFWHRANNVSIDALETRFTGNDAYLYFRQAERIVEDGGLPKRDMERWLPMGRDLSLLHTFYSYTIAYSYRVARVFVPDLTLYEFCCYVPPALFAAAAAIFMAALWKFLSLEIAFWATWLFIFSPSIASRTSLGFPDRDAFCLFLAVLMGALYLWQIKASGQRPRIALAGACGLASCIGCLAWEGFGVFVLCVLIPASLSAWRQKERVLEYIFYCACLTLPLLVTSSAHRFWVVPAEPAHPVGWLAIVPAFAALSIILVRFAFISECRTALKLASCLPAALIVLAIAIHFRSIASSFTEYSVPFSDSRLMRTVTELRGLSFNLWLRRFGALQLATAAAAIVGCWILLWKHRFSSNLELCIFGTIWVLVWGFLTYGSKRYALMLAPAIAVWSIVALKWLVLVKHRHQRVQNKKTDSNLQKSCSTFTMLSARIVLFLIIAPFAMLLWKPAGSLIARSKEYAVVREAKPNTAMLETMRWMNRNLDRSIRQPVVAAWWSVGSQLNVLADASTVVDQDLWKHYWIHLLARHLYCAENEIEALRFLKTRDADYWLLTSKDIRSPRRIARLGSAAEIDRSMDFARQIWAGNGSEAFELVFENAEAKIFRIHYPPDLTVPPELYEAWTAPDFPDPELRRVWMGGG